MRESIQGVKRSPVLRELARVAGGRPSGSAALRAAVATGVPLLAAHLLHEPELVWAAIGGFVGAMVDGSGSYRARAGNLAAVGTAVAAGGATAALLGHSPALAVTGMLLWGAVASFLRVYGTTGANVGLASSVTFAVSLATPAGPAEALARGGWLLAGAAWAALLALSLWPLRPLLPARRAVAGCYRALAAYAGRIAARTQGDGGAHDLAGRGFDGVRQSLEEAWRTLPVGWDGRGGPDAPVEQLLVLLENADQMLGALVALSDVAERLPDEPSRAALADVLREVADVARAVAGAVERGEPGGMAAPRPEGAEQTGGESAETPSAGAQADEVLRTLREFARGAGEVVAGSSPRPHATAASPLQGERDWAARLAPVRHNLSGESVLLRHALRLGITAALAVAISRGLGLEHGYWVTLTVIFILQPYAGLTLVKGLQRVVGTMLGGVVAVLVPMLVRDPLALRVLISVLAAVSVVTLPVNYAIFAFFVTPTFVLLAELQAGSWDLAGARVVNTLIGAGLAVAGAWLLWSLPERRRFPAHTATALRTAGGLLIAVAESPEQPASSTRVAALRRDLGLAIINAGESFQRLLIEEAGAGRVLEPERTLLVYLRRLAAASVALATAVPRAPAEAAAVRDFASAAHHALTRLADALTDGAPVPELPRLIAADACPPHLRPDLERVDRPIRVLYSAAARLVEHGAGSAALAGEAPR